MKILDRNKAKSRTGHVVKYAGCPITWVSKICKQKRAYAQLNQSL